ncbi:hypothetical protein DL95DRAFT_397676 [Leptodontidium sp. 2 PMI_412]|nr:hypothetical protein DL95DRAFT_397676 [Leptodontidium sp. 2 PMI_412]
MQGSRSIRTTGPPESARTATRVSAPSSAWVGTGCSISSRTRSKTNSAARTTANVFAECEPMISSILRSKTRRYD